jgi:hypothetical protein
LLALGLNLMQVNQYLLLLQCGRHSLCCCEHLLLNICCSSSIASWLLLLTAFINVCCMQGWSQRAVEAD